MTWSPQGPYSHGPMYHPPGAVPVGKPAGVVGAGVGLIIAGAVNFVCAAIWMAAGLSALHDEAQTSVFGASDLAAYLIIMSPVISVFVAPATIAGGMQMIRGKTYRLAMVGAIIALIPVSSCCFVAGVPLGIWALIVLRRPEVKAWFDSGGAARQQAWG